MSDANLASVDQQYLGGIILRHEYRLPNVLSVRDNHSTMSAPKMQHEHPTVLEREPWWRHVRDAIRGVHHDYTEGPIGRSLLLLAVPMVLETMMESLFAVVDVFFVAKLGADAGSSRAL